MSGDAREACKGVGAIIYVSCGASANKNQGGKMAPSRLFKLHKRCSWTEC